jgi:hypothetical protein
METLRVLVDTGDPCPGCGAPATVFQRAVDGLEVEWVVEVVECSRGCTEVAAAMSTGISVAAPAHKRRRRHVA